MPDFSRCRYLLPNSSIMTLSSACLFVLDVVIFCLILLVRRYLIPTRSIQDDAIYSAGGRYGSFPARYWPSAPPDGGQHVSPPPVRAGLVPAAARQVGDR